MTHGCDALPAPSYECFLLAVSGILKGYDQLLNVVLDETLEYLRGERERTSYICTTLGSSSDNCISYDVDPDDPLRITDNTRSLGLVVCRGTAVMLVAPTNGMEAISNPFVSQDE